MSPISVKVNTTEFDGPQMAAAREDIVRVARESLDRVSCNQSAILGDDAVRPNASSSGQRCVDSRSDSPQ